MIQSKWRSVLCSAALAAAVPGCTVEDGGGDLLRVDTSDEDDGAARFHLLHLERVGDRRTWRLQDYFVDGEFAGWLESPTSLDPEGRLSGTHRFDYFPKFVDETNGKVTYASEPAVSFDPIDFRPGHGYLLASIGEDGNFTTEVLEVDRPASGAELLVWNLSTTPMTILAWPEARRCALVGSDNYDEDAGEPEVALEVAPGERTIFAIEDVTMPYTINNDQSRVQSVEDGSVVLAVQLPPNTDEVQARLQTDPRRLAQSTTLLGRELWELEREGCEPVPW
jgi:hypothetical protein